MHKDNEMHFGGLGHGAASASQAPEAIKERGKTINDGRIIVDSNYQRMRHHGITRQF